MKIKKSIFSASLIMLMLFGCVSLEEELYDSLSREMINEDPNLAAKLLNGIYSPLNSIWNYFSTPFSLYTEIASDDCYFTRDNFPFRIDLDNFVWDPTDGTSDGFWENVYSSILLSNTFIDEYSEGASEEFINTSIGEASFLRALNYFNLLRFYGNIPLILDSKLSEEEKVKTPQAPIEDVCDAIVEDLLNAQNLPIEWSLENQGRPRKVSAMALLGKVYLFMASPGGLNQPEYYAKAAEIFKNIYDNSAELGVGLLPTYQDVFYRSAEYSEEMVFGVGFTGPGEPDVSNILRGQARPWIFEESPLGVPEGWGWFVGEMELYNAFSDDDARKEVTFATSWLVDLDDGGEGLLDDTVHYYDLPMIPIWTPSTADDKHIGIINDTTPHCGKWRWSDNTDFMEPRDDINIPVIRYSDCLLMWSEAELEANGPSADAYIGVNMVRERANLDPLSGLDALALRDSIRLECRREFAFELGHRWFDLLRWDIQGTIPSLVAKGIGNKKYLPIPNNQISISGGILVQNPDIP